MTSCLKLKKILETIFFVALGFVITGCFPGNQSSNQSNGTSSKTYECFSNHTLLDLISGSNSQTSANFKVTDNVVSFQIHVENRENKIPRFTSVTTPNETDIISSYTVFGGEGIPWESNQYSNFLVPLSPDYQATSGIWNYNISYTKKITLTTRNCSITTPPTITVQPYLTGSNFSINDIAPALAIMKSSYSKNGINLSIRSTKTISETKFAEISHFFTDSTTAELVSEGAADRVNIFFINDYTDSSYLGNSAGIPGSQGMQGSHNGILISLSTHLADGALQDQLLGETAGHEMGHFLGLYHTSESGGIWFDPIRDSPNCSKSNYDSDSSGQISAEECEQAGGNNLMFWTSYSSSSRNSGKKQDNLTAGQVYVIQHSPIAR